MPDVLPAALGRTIQPRLNDKLYSPTTRTSTTSRERAVGAINREIHSLAAVINSPTLPDAATVTVTPPEVSADMAQLFRPRGIAITVRKHQGMTYLFAVRMKDSPASATFKLKGLAGEAAVRVIGENRTIRAREGRFADDFAPHAVHLYQMDNGRG